MELSELSRYAEEKYGIHEEQKWADFPGFSVLSDPVTGKWIALFMRQWDENSGEIRERCDLKCPRYALLEKADFITEPFRLKGQNWIGIDPEKADKEAVCRIFDQAAQMYLGRGYTFILVEKPIEKSTYYQETSLPNREESIPERKDEIPQKIIQMQKMYRYADSSFTGKCRNFYVQGKFMEDYTDDYGRILAFTQYFPTYHDMSVSQLRSYFYWRSLIRKNIYEKTTLSQAYIYLYELLNGIGASSAIESLRKMKEFELLYLQGDTDDRKMRTNIRRWMLELAVINDIPLQTLKEYMDEDILRKDHAYEVLCAPETFGDEEIFRALCYFGGRRVQNVLNNEECAEEAIHLYSLAWKEGMHSKKDQQLFTRCFGEMQKYRWHPLGNAVYYWRGEQADKTYQLDGCRTYSCEAGRWYEKSYQKLYYDKNAFHAFLHASECLLRRYLKLPHPLKMKKEEMWAAEYMQRAIEIFEKEKIQSKREAIRIDLNELETIRKNALSTEESLLSETDQLEEIFMEEEDGTTEAEDTVSLQPGLIELTKMQSRVLKMLLKKENKEAYRMLADNHIMPEIFADALNELLFEEIGDTTVECVNDQLILSEYYTEEISGMLEGNAI